MIDTTRCNHYTEVVPGENKRCIRPHEHLEDSHVWIESLDKSGGAPKIVIWNKLKKIEAYIIAPEAVEGVDRTARAYGWEVGNGHILTEKINDLSDDNPFLDPNWKENIIKTGG